HDGCSAICVLGYEFQGAGEPAGSPGQAQAWFCFFTRLSRRFSFSVLAAGFFSCFAMANISVGCCWPVLPPGAVSTLSEKRAVCAFSARGRLKASRGNPPCN